MNKLHTFIKSVYAGFMIGMGGVVYLSLENKVVGSLMFSFGLMTIVVQEFCLYTGKIGFVERWKELPDILVIIIGNYIGTLIIAWAVRAAGLNIDSSALVRNKLDHSVWTMFLLSVLCGVLMYLAIDNYNKTKNIVFIIAPVMIFILSGFEHSVADMFYFDLAGEYSFKGFGYLLVLIAGNGVGAKVFSLKDCMKS